MSEIEKKISDYIVNYVSFLKESYYDLKDMLSKTEYMEELTEPLGEDFFRNVTTGIYDEYREMYYWDISTLGIASLVRTENYNDWIKYKDTFRYRGHNNDIPTEQELKFFSMASDFEMENYFENKCRKKLFKLYSNIFKVYIYGYL